MKINIPKSALENVQSQLQSMTKAMSASLRTQEIASAMIATQQQLIDAQQQMAKSIEPIFQAQFQANKTFENFENALQIAFSNYQIQMENLLSPALKNFLKSLEKLPEHLQTALLTLGNHGWFFDLEMSSSFLWALENALNQGDIKEAEEALSDYFRENLETIENRLITKFPHRTKILETAFSAHRRGEYELSIPVFLAQTDGVCYEAIKQYLFMRKKGKPKTAIYVDTISADTLKLALLAPLSQPLPISASQYERDESFNELNRHQVMHGEVVNYGTEINSLKSISLLNYVVQVLDDDDEA